MNQPRRTEKTCAVCGLTLPMEKFYRGSGRAKGWRPQCRACFTDAKSREKARRRDADAVFRVRLNRKQTARVKSLNETRGENHRSAWSTAEVNLARDMSMNADEVSKLIGRTIRAVQIYRRRFLGGSAELSSKRRE